MKVIRIRKINYDFIDNLKNSNFIVTIENVVVIFYRNGKIHNTNFAAKIYMNGSTAWYYKDKYYYGSGINFTNKTWKQKTRQLQREEELKIFL
jgi:hypothetical protein